VSNLVYKEYRLRVYENRMLSKKIGPKWDEVTGEWRRLHNEELYALYFSTNIIKEIKSKRMTWAKHVARIENRRGAHRVLLGKSEGKRPLERYRRRWKDNTNGSSRIGTGRLEWIALAQDRNK
jgi:hypothetical protein